MASAVETAMSDTKEINPSAELFLQAKKDRDGSALLRYCVARGYYTLGAQRKDEKPSHTSYDGYNLYIPSYERLYAHLLYAEDVKKGIVHYLNEVLDEIRRLGFDLDIDYDPAHPTTVEQVIEYARVLQTCLKRFYVNYQNPKDPMGAFRCVILVSPHPFKSKTGAHIVFWNHPTINERSQKIWAACIAELQNKYGERPPTLHPWCDVLDHQVLDKGKSLRMPYSHKLVNCCCQNKDFDKTKICPCRFRDGRGSGKYDDGRFYEPVAVLDGEGNLDAEILRNIKEGENPWFVSLTLTTLWVDPASTRLIPGWEASWAPPYNPPGKRTLAAVDDVSKYTPEQRMIHDVMESGLTQKVIAGAGFSPQDLLTTAKLSRKARLSADAKKELRARTLIDVDDPRFRAVEEWIRSSTEYPNVVLNSLAYRTGSDTFIKQYYAMVEGHGSRYCGNKKGDHKTSEIYFLIDRAGRACFQRCTSKKTLDRGHGPCPDYIGPAVPLSGALYHQLFPYPEMHNGKRAPVLKRKVFSSMRTDMGRIPLTSGVGGGGGASGVPNRPLSVDFMYSTAPRRAYDSIADMKNMKAIRSDLISSQTPYKPISNELFYQRSKFTRNTPFSLVKREPGSQSSSSSSSTPSPSPRNTDRDDADAAFKHEQFRMAMQIELQRETMNCLANSAMVQS